MPIQPWTTFHGDTYISQGFDAVAKVITDAERAKQQQTQFDAQLGEERRQHDLGYYGGEADRAERYYGVTERSKLDTQFAPSDEVNKKMLDNGYFFAPQGRHGGSWYPIKTHDDNAGPAATGATHAVPVLMDDQIMGVNYFMPGKKNPLFQRYTAQQSPPGITVDQKEHWIQKLETDIAQNSNNADVPSGYDLPKETRADAIRRLKREVQYTKAAQQPPNLEYGGVKLTPVQTPAPQPAAGGFSFGASAVPPSGTQPTAVEPPLPTGAAPSAAPRPLDLATAQRFVQQAGGDRNKARELARAAGYTF